MNREAILGAGAAFLVVASVLLAVTAPGVFADPDRGADERPGRIEVRELTIAPGPVTGDTATLVVTDYLTHRGGVSGNVTVVVRAVDLDSGFLETTEQEALSTVEGDREVPVTLNLTVEREGGYRVETVVYRDGRRVARGDREVRGVGTLQPAYASTGVRFHQFEAAGDAGLPAVQYSIADVTGNRTTLSLSAYLTNRGDAPSRDLRVGFLVRQADSNIVAARTSVDVSAVPPGRTTTPGASVTVPDGYNYYLDAILWKDGVIVGTARSVANLDPTERIIANATVREVGLRLGEFETDDAEQEETRRVYLTQTPSSPGFGPAAAGLALALLAALAGLRRHDT